MINKYTDYFKKTVKNNFTQWQKKVKDSAGFAQFTQARGFTLIELLLYIAIVTMVISALIPFAWNVILTGTKSSVQQEVSAQARFISEKIKQEIRSANGINTASSNFDVNLATNPSLQLSLIKTAANNPTLFSVNSGKLRIKQGAATAVDLHSNLVKVSNLTFSNYSSVDGKTKYIQFSFTLDANYPSARQEYIETITLQSGAEMRIN